MLGTTTAYRLNVSMQIADLGENSWFFWNQPQLCACEQINGFLVAFFLQQLCQWKSDVHSFLQIPLPLLLTGKHTFWFKPAQGKLSLVTYTSELNDIFKKKWKTSSSFHELRLSVSFYSDYLRIVVNIYFQIPIYLYNNCLKIVVHLFPCKLPVS